jgi:hypothetical protein
MTTHQGGSSRPAPRTVLQRAAVLALAFAGSLGLVALGATALSPWRNVARTFDVVLISEGCQLSEAAAVCLERTPRQHHEHPRAVAVPTEIEGELARSGCAHVRAALASAGDLVARASLFASSEESWCQRLAQGGRQWLLEHGGKERWPTFVHEGELAGVGLLAENFVAVGEPEVGAGLDECVASFMEDLEERRVGRK